MSLVADYASSDEDDDGETNATECDQTEDTARQPSSITESKAENFFDAADESDAEENVTEQCSDPAGEPSPETSLRLPNPLSGGVDAADDDERQASVFTNYFHKAEEAKLAILERHVKLTKEQLRTSGEQKRAPNRKGLCVSFQQRGSCRFGSKCRFSHSLPSTNETAMSSEVTVSVPKFGLLPSAQLPLHAEPADDEDGFNAERKRKHRSGVTNSLVPPKRAMQSLQHQRKEERPWTVGPR